MQTSLNQKNGPREDLEASKSRVLDSVLQRNRMSEVRREIGYIADRSHRENLISDEAYQEYRELAENRDGQEIDANMLNSMRSFAKEHEVNAVRIHNKIQTAIQKKIASEGDEEFLMEKLVIDNEKFVSQAGAVEALVDAKLMRMEKDKERYDKLAGHELIENIGYLKVDGNTKIDFPSEDEFLALTVPERRELLNNLEKSLPKAEAHAKENQESEDKALLAEYKGKLQSALERRIIGKKTHDKFLNGFMKIDHEEQGYWNEEFEAEMERYELLWEQIHGTLQGSALASIEAKRDNSGYTQLFTEFGRLKESESKRLVGSYAVALEKNRKEGIIGRHTMTQFMLWMNHQELSDKYEAEDLLPGEMERYEDLWGNISQLGGKQQKFLRDKIDVWGYTELNQHYEGFKNGTLQVLNAAKPDPLSRIQSTEVKNAIIDTNDILKAQGKGKRKSFIGMLGHMFSGVSRDSFDATSFETELRRQVVKNNPDIEMDYKGRGADDEVDFNQISDDADILEETGQVADVVEENGFVQVESKEQGGKVHRETQVTINEEDGVRRLWTEEAKHSYRSSEAGGNDEMSLAIYSSGRTYELNLEETRATFDFLKIKDQEETLDETD